MKTLTQFKEEKKYYAWVGQNASTGTPNQTTGRMSMYGTILVFSTKKKRDRFVSEYYDPNGNKYAVSGSAKKMRTFCLGQSVRDFENDLEYLDVDIAIPTDENDELKY